MKKINKISIYSPGGNITAIVRDKVSRKTQPAIAQKIINIYNKYKPVKKQIEQIAFEEKPKNKNALSRLQLTGGEFSGNATLCFATLKLKKQKKGLLEISGTKCLLETTIYPKGLVKTQMPMSSKKILKSSKEGFPLILLQGISYLVVNKLFDEKNIKQNKIALDFIRNNNLLGKNAVGVLFTKKVGKKIKMKPYVYFKKGLRYNLCKETACGSGSTAIAINEYFERKKAIKNLEIVQPSGNIIFVTVKKTNCQLKAWIKNRVEILYQGPFNLTDRNHSVSSKPGLSQ